MDCLTFATFNAAGLARQSKRLSLDFWCNKLGISICAIQESNLVKETYQMIYGRIVGVPSQSCHAGLALWIANGLSISNIEIYNVVPDSVQEVSFFLNEIFFIIYNLHLPHADGLVVDVLEQWIQRLRKWSINIPVFATNKNRGKNYDALVVNSQVEDSDDNSAKIFMSSTPQPTFLVMGDFNLEIERVGRENIQCKKKLPRSIISTILAALDLNALPLTLVSVPPPTTRGSSIIDYVCTPKSWYLMLSSLQVVNDLLISDHSMIVATFYISYEHASPPYWRLKNLLLTYLPFEYSMMDFLTNRTSSYPMESVQFIAWWDRLKMDIIEVSKKSWYRYSKIKKKLSHHHSQSLNTRMNTQKLSKLVSPKIRFLKDSKGVTQSQPEKIMSMIRGYYADLFVLDSNTIVPPSEMTFGLPQIDQRLLESLNSPITVDDLYVAATSLNHEKAPGGDGITLEFYIKFWKVMGPLIFCWFGHVMSMGKLSGTAAMGVISLINKPGDHRLLVNWRPIMLLTLELKIVARAITNKIQPAIATVLSQHQMAMPGQSIFNAHAIIRDVIAIAEKETLPLWITSLDLSKAFDNVAHSFLFHLLQIIGLPEYYLKAVKSLYTGFRCSIKNVSELSDGFEYSKGIRQGDPMSTCLFALALQPLLNALLLVLCDHGLRLPSGQKVVLTAYADDISLFLSDTQSLSTAIEVFNEIAIYSGARLNITKSKVLAINVLPTQHPDKDQHDIPHHQSQLQTQLIKISYESIKILGIVYLPSLNICTTQWQEKMDSSFKTISNYFTDLIQMSYYKRAMWAKKKIWPRWTFLLKVLQPSKAQLMQLKNMFGQVIWLDNRHWMKPDVLTISIQNGGLGAISPSHRITIMRVMMMKKILEKGKESLMYQLAELNLNMYANGNLGFKILHSIPEADQLKTLQAVYASALVAWNSLPICFSPRSVSDILEMPVASSKFLAQLDEPVIIKTRQASAMGLTTIKDLYWHVPSITRQSKLLSVNVRGAIDQWVLPPWPGNTDKELYSICANEESLQRFVLMEQDSIYPFDRWSAQLIIKCFKAEEDPPTPMVPQETWRALYRSIAPPAFVNQYWRFLHGRVTTPRFYQQIGLIAGLKCLFCTSSESSLDHQFNKCPTLSKAKDRLNNFIKDIGVPFLDSQHMLYQQPINDHMLANFLIISFIYTVAMVSRARANSMLNKSCSQQFFLDKYISVINGHLTYLAATYPMGSPNFEIVWSPFVHKGIVALLDNGQLFIISKQGFVPM